MEVVQCVHWNAFYYRYYNECILHSITGIIINSIKVSNKAPGRTLMRVENSYMVSTFSQPCQVFGSKEEFTENYMKTRTGLKLAGKQLSTKTEIQSFLECFSGIENLFYFIPA